MKNSVLIIAQNFGYGGLETHILNDIACLKSMGYHVYTVIGTSDNTTVLEDKCDGVFLCSDIADEGDLSQLLRGIEFLKKIIVEQNISLVNVHPFSCLLPAVIAANSEDIPSALTLHGPLSADYFIKDINKHPLFIYLLNAVNIVSCVSEEVAQQVSCVISDINAVRVFPNVIEFPVRSDIKRGDKDTDGCWLMASRLDADKLEGIISFIDLIKDNVRIKKLDIYGAGNNVNVLEVFIADNNLQEKVFLKGFSEKVPELMPTYTGFAGMGRGVIEAAANGLSICLVGYDGVKGILNNERFTEAAKFNFSGRNFPNIDSATLNSQLESLPKIEPAILKKTNDSSKWNVLTSLSRAKDNISSNELYHLLTQIPYNDNASIYIYEFNFMKTMLATISKGYSIENKNFSMLLEKISQKIKEDMRKELINITDKIVQNSADQETLFNSKINELNTHHLAKINDSRIAYELILQNIQKIADKFSHDLKAQSDYIDSKINKLSEEIQEFRSVSKVKKRSKMKFIFQALFSKQKRYELIRGLYWKLPEKFRLKLTQARYAYVRKHRSFEFTETKPSEQLAPENYPEWIKQCILADKVVFIPCGFEFQETVNQRPINAAKYFSQAGYQVIFIAWQWSADEVLEKGCSEVWNNVYQVPLYEFVRHALSLDIKKKRSLYLVTMPADVFSNSISHFRKQGVAIIYDIMDEWECFSEAGQAPWYEKSIERNLVLNSDYVCCVAPALKEKFIQLRQDIHIIGNGYSVAVLGDTRNIAQGNENKIGYFGHLTDAWFDWDVVFELADSYPAYKFELIGYGEPQWVVDKVKDFSNIHLIGKVPPQQLHSYVKSWSVGLIPFRKGKLSESVDPIKIYEYIYFGLPTLVTGIEHIKNYPITYFSNKDDIHTALKKAMYGPHDLSMIEQFLAETTWDARFHKIENEVLDIKTIKDLYVA